MKLSINRLLKKNTDIESYLVKRIFFITVLISIPQLLSWGYLYHYSNAHLAGYIIHSWAIFQIATLIVYFIKAISLNLIIHVQLIVCLLINFAVSFLLGGIINSGGQFIWAFIAPLAAMLYGRIRFGIILFIAFLLLVALCKIVGPIINTGGDVKPFVREIMLCLNITGPLIFAFVIVSFFVSMRSVFMDLLQKEKERVLNAQKMLTRYVAPQLSKKILNGDVELVRNHNRLKLSLFFSDIHNFTGITDILEPEDLAELLNDYFYHMFDIIDKFGGTLAQMTGDGLYVFFGAPDSTNDVDHAERCVNMAIEMQLKMSELQKKWYESGIESPFKIRCGINTGLATVGSYGTKKRMEYVAMGMQVNIASRLESSAEPGSIYLSHSTWGLIKDKIACDKVGIIEVKGLSRPINAYKINLD